jgi:transposase-like protein
MAKPKRVTRQTVEARERWTRIVREWRKSGLSVRAFCQKHGVPEYGLYAWRRRFRNEKGTDRRDGKAAFVPVRVVPQGTSSTGLEISFPSGHVLRAGPQVDTETLARAVALLDGKPC